jgi:hypothetical protein
MAEEGGAKLRSNMKRSRLKFSKDAKAQSRYTQG